jgi:hypothetical protein
MPWNISIYTILETPPPVIPFVESRSGLRYQMVTCCLACLECWRSLALPARCLNEGAARMLRMSPGACNTPTMIPSFNEAAARAADV